MPGAHTFLAAVEAYDRYIGRYSPQLGAALADFAGVARPLRALDVGCGSGALTAVLASRLGAENVSAADPSEPFTGICRERVPGATVVVAPAESLPFGDGEFDATLAQLVVNFMNDAVAGVREMSRVTRPGGTVAGCVWDYRGEMTLVRAFWDSAHEVTPERAAANDEGTMMRWSGEGELAELWEQVGLSGVRFAPLDVTASYADFEDLWAPLPTGIGPAGAFAKALPEPERSKLRDALRARLGVGDGPFELSARAWAAAGTVG